MSSLTCALVVLFAMFISAAMAVPMATSLDVRVGELEAEDNELAAASTTGTNKHVEEKVRGSGNSLVAGRC